MIAARIGAGVRERRSVSVRGMVQGVGFRPFVYRLAGEHRLGGWVRNDDSGVQIEVEGPPEALEAFLRRVREEPPPPARVDSLSWRILSSRGESDFRIEASRGAAEPRALVAPDTATCAACLRELFDSADRRYRYPFINCTHCGPRFTLIRGVPYDRHLTTMSAFEMCEPCSREYEDPHNRRFHAQPNACPTCGPQVRLVDQAGRNLFPSRDAIEQAADLLREGAVLAVKGLGGYHLACDPFNGEAVAVLRTRKVRQDRPFALMARDSEQARELCRVSPEEAEALEDPARPIVLLERRPETAVDAAVAPRQDRLGVMLAYTPLHHLLLHAAGGPLVMTSGNRSDEPIAFRDEDTLAQLGDIADAFLVHNRPIHVRCDDSVVRVEADVPGRAVLNRHWTFLRRSRGFAPAPLRLAEAVRRPVLACGAELKATFCLVREQQAFVSPHIGDLQNYETLCSYRDGIDHYCRLFDVRPEVIACDLHPEYLSTRYAQEAAETGLPLVPVQHHQAHVASCLADNERPPDEPVIGVAFDGTGYGEDGAVWGGEFFTGSLRGGFVRQARMEYVPLPGGDAAVRQPWRMAVSHLLAAFGLEETLRLPLPLVRNAGEKGVRVLARMAGAGINSPLTSSAGRLFDAVAALLGLPGTVRTTYEGQAAVELELAAGSWHANAPYPFRLSTGDGVVVLELRDLVESVVRDRLAGRSIGEIAGRFHATVAGMIVEGCIHLRDRTGIGSVALSGGTFQNRLLLHQASQRLAEAGFMVYRHRRVPANDGGLALGQAVLADHALGRVPA